MCPNISIFVLFLLNSCLCFAETDKTLEDRATDVDVVDLVIKKIADSSIFPDDNGIMKRIAWVESRFGLSQNAFRQNYFGGIWQVDQDNFTQYIKTLWDSHPEIDRVLVEIKNKFVNLTDLKEIQYQDLLKPIYSGLVARIILHFSGVLIPGRFDIRGQAEFWNKYYRKNGSVENFIKEVDIMEKEFGISCSGRMDLAIVMDSSGSIGSLNYQKAKDFVVRLIATFSLESVNIGFVVFSDDSKVIFTLNSNFTLQEMNSTIMNSRYLSRGTNTNLGIEHGVEILTQVEGREGVPKIMAIFTDGAPTCYQYQLDAALNKARSNNITIFAIGIGGDIKQSKLKEMTNSSSRVFSMQSYDTLSKSFALMNSETCKVPQKPIVGKTVTDSIKKREKRYFHFRIPIIGITIKLSVHVGSTKGYFSYHHENPSSALHDGEFTDQTFIPCPHPNSHRFKRDVSNETYYSNVFVAVEGREQINNYTLASEEGNHVSASNLACFNIIALLLPLILYFLI